MIFAQQILDSLAKENSSIDNGREVIEALPGFLADASSTPDELKPFLGLLCSDPNSMDGSDFTSKVCAEVERYMELKRESLVTVAEKEHEKDEVEEDLRELRGLIEAKKQELARIELLLESKTQNLAAARAAGEVYNENFHKALKRRNSCAFFLEGHLKDRLLAMNPELCFDVLGIGENFDAFNGIGCVTRQHMLHSFYVLQRLGFTESSVCQQNWIYLPKYYLNKLENGVRVIFGRVRKSEGVLESVKDMRVRLAIMFGVEIPGNYNCHASMSTTTGKKRSRDDESPSKDSVSTPRRPRLAVGITSAPNTSIPRTVHGVAMSTPNSEDLASFFMSPDVQTALKATPVGRAALEKLGQQSLNHN